MTQSWRKPPWITHSDLSQNGYGLSLSLSLTLSLTLSLSTLTLSLSTPIENEVKTCVLHKKKGKRDEQRNAQINSPSYIGAVLPASLTIAFVLISIEHPSHVRLLLVGSCGVEGVRLSTYQCPFNDESHFPESRRSVELSTSSFGKFRR